MELTIWKSHIKGEETRQNIISFLSPNDGKSLPQIAVAINRSLIQTRRQVQKLSSVGAVVAKDGLYFTTPKADSVNLTSYWD